MGGRASSGRLGGTGRTRNGESGSVAVARTSPMRKQPFRIRHSRIQGRGAFATRAIRKGERIIEYVGERISSAEADRRAEAGGPNHHTVLFEVTRRVYIDAAVGGNDSRFINHSCDPNCESVDDGGRIFIEALRDIRRGEELSYDYAYEREGHEHEADYICRCGVPTCRRTILEPPKDTGTRVERTGTRPARRKRAKAS